MDPQEWFRAWFEHFGPLPDDYLVIDCETTGVDISRDLILQLGWCKVCNHQVIENAGVDLNWNKHYSVDPCWLHNKLESTRRYMLSKGNAYPWSIEQMSSGSLPEDALADLLTKFQHPETIFLASHNGWRFDAPIIEKHFRSYLFEEYKFKDRLMIDTGAIEKAIQLGTTPRLNESMKDFCLRVTNRPSKIKWSLAKSCIPKYNLDTKYSLDLNNAHNAIFDSYATSCLLEHFRDLITASIQRKVFHAESQQNQGL